MNSKITNEILAFMIEVNSNISHSNIVMEWEPSDYNDYRFRFYFSKSVYFHQPMWTPQDLLFKLVNEKAKKYFGEKTELRTNNTGNIIWFYFEERNKHNE